MSEQIQPANLLKLIKALVETAVARAGKDEASVSWHKAMRREIRFGWQDLCDKIDKVAALGDDLLLVVAQAIAKPDDYDLLEVISDLLAERWAKGSLIRIMPEDGEIIVIGFPIPATAQLRQELEGEMELLATNIERHARKMGRRVFALVVPEQVGMTAGTAAGRRLQEAGYVRAEGQQALLEKIAALERENKALRDDLHAIYRRQPQLPKIVIKPGGVSEEEAREMAIVAGKAGIITPLEVMEKLGMTTEKDIVEGTGTG